MPAPVVELLAELGATFDRLGVRWYLFGAQAAILHGSPRLTADVDVTIDLGDRPAAVLIDTLDQAGFRSRVTDPVEFASRNRVLPTVHTASGIAVDVILGGPGLEERFLQRSRYQEIEGVRVPVASAEDIVIMKILAGRAKDLEDTVAILTAHRDSLDLPLVRETLGMLEEALDRRDLIPVLEQALVRARRR